MNHFHPVDYVIFVIMLLFSLGIGIYSSFSKQREHTTADYLMGNRQMRVAPVALSICVSMVSANTLVGLPAEIYGFGIHYCLISVLMPLGGLILAYTLVPVLYPLKIVSIHQYLEMRFGSKTIKWYGTAIQIILQVLYVGTVLFGPAICLEVATGIPTWISLIITAALGISYTTIGGMRGVVWTDTFQSIIMILGNIALIIIGCIKIGSVTEVWNINKKWGRLNINFSADPTTRLTFWSSTIGGMFLLMCITGANQPCMQRSCTVKNLTLSRYTTILGSSITGSFTVFSSLVGCVIFAYYAKLGCDPVQAKYIASGNQILPYFIMDVLSYPGLPGLLFSCLFSGSLSSLSSSANSMSAVLWADVLEPNFKHWTESQKTMCSKVLTIIFGLTFLASSFMMLFVGGSLIAIAASVLGAVLGPLLGVFFLATLVPFTNWIGALVGGTIGIAYNIWLMFGAIMTGTQTSRLPAPTYGCFEQLVTSGNSTQNSLLQELTTATIEPPQSNATYLGDMIYTPDGEGFIDWMYSISFCWYPCIGVIVSMTIGITVSLISGYTKPENINPDYVASYVLCRKPTEKSGYKLSPSRDNEVYTHAHVEPTHTSGTDYDIVHSL